MSNTALAVPDLAPSTVHLVARSGNEMELSRQAMLNWLLGKIHACQNELLDMQQIVAHAKKNKWRSSGLERQVKLAQKRLLFYEKCQLAVNEGYTLVPNFPADLFAIRVTRDHPSSRSNSSTYRNPSIEDEKPSGAKAGDGEYVSPEAKLNSWETEEKNSQDKMITRWHSEPVEFQDVEFPVACARPEVMSAVSEAMQKKIFDAFAISPQGIMRKRKYDPIILGQICMPKGGGYAQPKIVSFMIAWHLDLRTL